MNATPFELNPASDFCQRWNNRQHSWRHRSDGGFDRDRYTVEPIAEQVAKDFVVRHHYSGTYPASIQRYGIFDGNVLGGVLVFGAPVQTKALTIPFPELDPFRESCELSRLVMLDELPANSESFFVARCFEEAAARGMRGVVSFADPVPRVVGGRVLFPGHVGTIYQSLNAKFCGRGTARTLTLLPDGTVFNHRAEQKVRSQERGHEYVERNLIELGARPMRAGEKPTEWLAAALEDIGVTKLRHRGNLRYCFPIGSKAQRRQVRIALPHSSYPKQRDAA